MPYYVQHVNKRGKPDVRRKCPICNAAGFRYQGLLLHLRQGHGRSRRGAEDVAKVDKAASAGRGG